MRPDPDTIALGIELLRTHVNVLAITGEDVCKPGRHLQGLQPVLDIRAGFGVAIIDKGFLHQSAGEIELNKTQPTVEEIRTPGDAIDRVILDQNAAVNRPD